jgi:hypothetical protein
VHVIAALRRLRFTGLRSPSCWTGPLSTVSAVLKRIGMGKLARLGLEPAQPTSGPGPATLLGTYA